MARGCGPIRSPTSSSPPRWTRAPPGPRAPDPAAASPKPLTPAELRILKLLPTSTYLQIAETLFISRNTVKVHLRAVYQKLGVTSRAQALERAVDLHLL